MVKDDRLNQWLIRVFYFVITNISLYGASQLNQLSRSVTELNLKMAVYIEKLQVHSEVINDHEERIRLVEKEKNHGTIR